MQKPVIGLTTFHTAPPQGHYTYISLTEAYVQAVLTAGGVPLLIPIGLAREDLAQLRPLLSGVLLTGGGDIDPQRYNGALDATVKDIDPARDQIEIDLTLQAIETGLPFLGICRGLQLVNIALGGTLYTDIATQHPGRTRHNFIPDYPRDMIAHSVAITPGSRLRAILADDTVQVNSLHHQAVRDLAPGLVASSFSPDGVLESFELPGHPFGLAVQWHPEWLQAQAPMRALFRSFILAAQ